MSGAINEINDQTKLLQNNLERKMKKPSLAHCLATHDTILRFATSQMVLIKAKP